MESQGMPLRTPTLLRFTVLAAALALAACGRGDEGNLASLDNQLAGNDVDPALTSALEDQIAVDPELAQQSNRNAVRPPETPTQAPYPQQGGGGTLKAPEPGQKAAAQPAALASGAAAGCTDANKFEYNLAWAQKMPATFPVYPGAKVTDAAANQQSGCAARVVTFTTGDNFQRVLDWYHTQAVRAGYSSEHQIREGDHILAGAHERQGGAFYLIATPKRNGAEVALIVNGAS
jgi:hypothetical protein